VVVSNLDNLVWLAVYRRVSGIHPMLTLVGALAGMRVFGMLGVLFGPLALSYFFELLGIYGRCWRSARRSYGSSRAEKRLNALPCSTVFPRSDQGLGLSSSGYC
jgi:hypothetical protein